METKNAHNFPLINTGVHGLCSCCRYIIATSHTMPVIPARTIVVSGGNCSQRGTMYAAFGLLRSLGFKFLAPDETVTPTAAAAVAVAAASGLDAHVVPRMIWRSHESYETDGADPDAVRTMFLAANLAG